MRRPSFRAYQSLGFVSLIPAIVAIASATGIIGGGGSSSGGSASGVPGAMSYVPQWQGGADQMWQQIMQQFGNLAQGQAGTAAPFLNNSFMNSESRVPWMTSRMDTMGDTLDSVGTRFLNAQDNLYGAGNEVFQTAQDPQQALYNRTLQQVTDQSRAASSARGIGSSAESAGLENQATSNFNIDWQNQQLQRQLQGLQGMMSAYSGAGQQGLAGATAYGDAAGMYSNASMLPYTLANAYGGAMGSSVYNPLNALQGDLSTYLGLGQSGSSAAFGQGQTNMNSLTSGLNSVFNSSMWNTIANSFSPNNPNNNNYGGDGGSNYYGDGYGPS